MRICLENENFDTLNQELNQFYQAQADVRLKANDILVPLSDEYIYIAVMNHTLQGYYYKAAKIMMYREKLAETLSQELIQAKQLIAFCRELSIAIYDEKSVGMVKSILSQNPAYEGVLDFQKAELWVLYKTASNKNDFEELIQKSQVLLKTHENDGEILGRVI